jgi:histidinol dehydrogenase
MIRRLDLRSGLPANLGAVVPRAQMDVEHAMEVVRPIVADVAKRGAPAVLDHGERLDGVRARHLRVPAASRAQALDELDPEVRDSLALAIERVRAVHADQLPQERTTQVVPGGTVTMRWVPVDRVGLYVPGGRAVYPSSVVMNVVPAQIAGVGSLAVASPPQREHGGLPHPTILAACAMLGVDEVYAAGGAQAVALLAHGAPLEDGTVCRPVDLVTGPGNIWVTAAKRLLKGRIGIDSEAGPTEIAILADESADPRLVAADLLSQAEHDVIAASVLVTSSPKLASAVEAALDEQVAAARHSLRIREALGGMQSAIILVDSIRDGLEVVNAYAAEHLEIHTRHPREVAMKVRNAGAVFVGPHSPVSLGDYAAGSNHVLPTGGSAAHSSGLGVVSFLRGINVVEYDAQALADVAPHVVTLAHAEDLPGHAAAVTARFEQ